MIYESVRCYPDLIDFQNILKRSFADKKNLNAEDLYQDFRAAYEWLRIALHVSHSNGRHACKPIDDVREAAEKVIGRAVSEDAFLAAVHIVMRGNKLRKDGIKVPPFNNERIAAAWKQHEEETR